jgi:hypothetical protein
MEEGEVGDARSSSSSSIKMAVISLVGPAIVFF